MARPTKSKTSKTVRIISPHSAEEHDPIPDEFFDTSRRKPFSPALDPSPPKDDDDRSSENPFGAGSEGPGSSTEDEDTRPNAQGNVRESLNTLQKHSDMPANPFKRTLADSREQDLVDSTQFVSEQKSAGGNNPPARPQYDVDEFKRLLLSGDKVAPNPHSTSAPSVSFGHTQNGDSSSNTDASSVSRQSIFEPPVPVHPESPRTSHESSDDDRQHLVVASEPKRPTAKPSAPKPRHGKPMQISGPQTITFEDPTLSSSNLDGPRPPSKERFPPVSPQSPIDKYKALRALPSPPATTELDSAQHKARTEPSAEQKESQMSSYPPKKPAPAPPPSRRTRPMSISSINSGRSIPLSEEPSTEAVQMSANPPSRPSNAPAPPPPRRSNTFRGDSSSSTPTFASLTGSSDQSIPREQSPTPLQRARVPVTSNQSPSMLASKGPRRTSPASGSPSMAPPPPPPPRRRGSSQSSYTYVPSRLSGNHSMPNTERGRSDSGASSISQLPLTNIEMTSEPKSEQDDVIADLATLQREVDELRGKIR